MHAQDSGLPTTSSDVPRRFVGVEGRNVHYRVLGDGPAVVMLHDSPRSSRLHLATIRRLSRRFRVFALDTPGYGNSDRLDLASPGIEDFAAALGATLDALGLVGAPLYATHTSAKIALEYAASAGPVQDDGTRAGRPARLVLDGLSIPDAPADLAFIERYMRPFHIEETGGYIAAEWTRMRDMVRWFPWFSPRPASRIPVDLPDDAWVSDYIIDFFSAGPAYSSAYAAAMRYDPLPALRRVTCPTLIAAKSDDVLFGFLDSVPVKDNRALSVERLGTDREAWLAWLEDAFATAVGDVPSGQLPPQPHGASFYVDLPHGPIRLHGAGPPSGQPLLILSAPTTLHALTWQAALSDRATLVPELPGFGESAAMDGMTLESCAAGLASMLAAVDMGSVNVLGIGLAAPLAAMIAARHPDRVKRVILDGCFSLPDSDRAAFADALCPAFPFDRGGGHLHRYWHMLRDAEANWPWHARDSATVLTRQPVLAPEALHAALLGILKQPGHYGDAARAACLADGASRYPAFDQPALLLHRAADPEHTGTVTLAAGLPAATITDRPASLEAAAAIVKAYLASAPDAPHGKGVL